MILLNVNKFIFLMHCGLLFLPFLIYTHILSFMGSISIISLAIVKKQISSAKVNKSDNISVLNILPNNLCVRISNHINFRVVTSVVFCLSYCQGNYEN